MDFSISDAPVRDWRAAPDEPEAAEIPMSEQIWEVLESFEGPAQIASLMQGMRLIDSKVRPDSSIDAGEWAIATAAMRCVLLQPYDATTADRLYAAIEEQLALPAPHAS